MDFLTTKTALRAASDALRTRLTAGPYLSSTRPNPAPLTTGQSKILAALIRANAGLSPERIARLFEGETSRTVSTRTVASVARRITRPAPRKSRPADHWPAWTDAVCVDIPWHADDLIGLGPNALPIGGGR